MTIRAENDDVHRFTETVIDSGSKKLVTELVMMDTADLSRTAEKKSRQAWSMKCRNGGRK